MQAAGEGTQQRQVHEAKETRDKRHETRDTSRGTYERAAWDAEKQ